MRPHIGPFHWPTAASAIPCGAGLYVIWGELPSPSAPGTVIVECLYVGMSAHVRTRLGAHFGRNYDARPIWRQLAAQGWQFAVTVADYSDDATVAAEMSVGVGRRQHRWVRRPFSHTLWEAEAALIRELCPLLNKPQRCFRRRAV